jgi:hypothetical protein
MTATDTFFQWFYTGLNGLGGWFIFLLLALAADIWLLYDSQKRHMPAVGWRMAVILLTALILPALIFRLSGADTQLSLATFVELIFYLGLLGGILPPVLAVGYYVTFRGMTGCPQGHTYEVALGQCPECARLNPPPQPPRGEPNHRVVPPQAPVAPPREVKPKVQAWLVTADGHNYQLNQGETVIGRSSQNDIQVPGDTTVSKLHAKIVEQNGHFHFYDLGSANGSRVNGHLVRKPELLDSDDNIQLGDNTHLRFLTSRS